MRKPPSKLIFTRGGAVFVMAVTMLITFVTIYLVQHPVYKKQFAAPEASLRLVPRNIAQNSDGTWQITQGQEVIVDVVLDSSFHQIEAVETALYYDPTVLTLDEAQNPIMCNNLTPLSHIIQSTIDNQSGTASVACTAATPTNRNDYTVLPPRYVGTIASFTFTALQTAQDSELSIQFNPENPRNDSNVLEYEGQCCSTTDVLLFVEDLTFDVVSQDSVATLKLVPSTDNVVVNEPFTAEIVLSTGPYETSGVDVILDYDATKLRADSVTPSTLFDQYVLNPTNSGITVSGSNGQIQLSGLVAANQTSGIQGDDLVVARVQFTPLERGVTTVTFYTNEADPRNDTNISEFGQANDLLENTTPGTYIISETGITPTPIVIEPQIYLHPDVSVSRVNQAFDVEIYFSTTDEQIDAIDAVVEYDPLVLSIQSVTNGTVFNDYILNPPASQLTQANGTISISGLIDPDSSPVSGNNVYFATITFIPLIPADETEVSLIFEQAGARNDSNMSRHGDGADILASVRNGVYSILDSDAEIVELIRLILSLEGRTRADISSQRGYRLRILETYFDDNPIQSSTDFNGVSDLTNTELQNRLITGVYDMIIKPTGYLQKRFNVALLETTNTIDLTDLLFPAGDFDGNGEINGLDWRIYIDTFNSSDDLVDINGDTEVNGLDSLYLIQNWNKIDES